MAWPTSAGTCHSGLVLSVPGRAMRVVTHPPWGRQTCKYRNACRGHSLEELCAQCPLGTHRSREPGSCCVPSGRGPRTASLPQRARRLPLCPPDAAWSGEPEALTLLGDAVTFPASGCWCPRALTQPPLSPGPAPQKHRSPHQRVRAPRPERLQGRLRRRAHAPERHAAREGGRSAPGGLPPAGLPG